jgi:hypothetical protein
MWSWEDHLKRSDGDQWTQSQEYTSVILKDTSRRIMQKIHAVEKLECFEVLIEIWQTTVKQQMKTSDCRSKLFQNQYLD